MKHRSLLLFSGVAALLLSACSTAPMAHNGSASDAESGVPWSSPVPGQGGGVLDGMPKAAPPATSVTNIVTGGLRSGDEAINRNNIDAVLNNPNRSVPPKEKATARATEERPGLATGYGSTVNSPWDRRSFERASTKPAGTDMIYYNDEDGIEAMSGYYKSPLSGARRAAGEMLEWGVKGSFGYLPAYTGYNGRSFVMGKKGGNYSIVLKNRCKSSLEVVVSVDGLDVIDGKTASVSKRGYVIAPDQTMEIKGWRTSPDSVARFQFSSVGGSYANLAHGETRNVGVIGIAAYTEKGIDPWTWMPDEVRARGTANPFAH